MLKKVLIANRGEIAVRVIRACQELGIGTVAVYSEADRKSLHVRYADEAHYIGASAAGESYLRIDRLIEAAQKSGAEAIHPGYGFLSERAEFAEACAQAGLIFIGPSAEAIRRMGDKTEARKLVAERGIPIVPGAPAELQTAADAHIIARQIGYPLLIKASAGGGGKGMRSVRKEDELEQALEAAAREATAAFGHGGVYIEKMLEKVRHIEIQIIADHHGNTIYLGERECSLQRRHQKVIEEAPSPAPQMTAALRESMGKVAVAAAQAVNYTNAGTVEFLLIPEGDFYFLEMNTRLQVEHPVTELVTGIDIVQMQLKIAGGEELPFKQEDIQIRGAAIECRIVAEDPYNNNLPGTGIIAELREPEGPGVRLDSGIYTNQEISLYYDSLLAKLIVLAPTREEAIARMGRALNEYTINGIKTNIPFHQEMLASGEFRAATFHTAYLDQEWKPLEFKNEELKVIAALGAALTTHLARESRRKGDTQSAAGVRPAQNSDGAAWKMAGRQDRLRGR